MKRLTAGLLALMLLATLLPGCGKKEQWNVDNFFLSDDGTTYSVSYRHDDGTEEVVAEMGSYPQPLTIIAGKLYYVHGGSMVAVDLKDPTQRQTLTEPGLSGLSIGFIDDGAVYCPLATDTEKCYRVALDLSECTRVAIPREQRPTDYDALLDQIYAAVGADGGVPCLNPDGSAAQLPQGSLLVLAQCYDRGDANIALTDSQGLTTGALRVIVPAA